jgi:hypothetical protein
MAYTKEKLTKAGDYNLATAEILSYKIAGGPPGSQVPFRIDIQNIIWPCSTVPFDFVAPPHVATEIVVGVVDFLWTWYVAHGARRVRQTRGRRRKRRRHLE